MQAPAHPEFGPMRTLVSSLDAAHAQMLAEDLQDLQIPALVREHRPDPARHETGHGLEVLVPEALHEVALQVIDVTTLKPEGETPVTEILAAFQPAARPSEIPAPRRTGFATKLFLLLALLTGILAVILLF